MMAEHIDREPLRKILKDWRDAHADADDEQGCGLLEDVIWEVDAQPTADVAPVVRCKDCKHSWEDISGLCCSHGVCVDLNVPGDFYCAYGKRKDVGDRDATD